MASSSEKLQPDYSQWPTKEQAATLLDCSTKTVEKFADEGKLQTVRWRRPTGGPKISVYHPVDVENLRRERFPDAASSFVMPAPAASPKSPTAANEEAAKPDSAAALRIIGAFLEANSAAIGTGPRLLGTSQKPRKPDVPIEHRVYLTVREASAYAGRPEKHLRRMIAQGTLPANKEGHTRVRRADLDKL
jgi:excisionase family DNA binding protein